VGTLVSTAAVEPGPACVDSGTALVAGTAVLDDLDEVVPQATAPSTTAPASATEPGH
jgi:hypothetical protein